MPRRNMRQRDWHRHLYPAFFDKPLQERYQIFLKTAFPITEEPILLGDFSDFEPSEYRDKSTWEIGMKIILGDFQIFATDQESKTHENSSGEMSESIRAGLQTDPLLNQLFVNLGSDSADFINHLQCHGRWEKKPDFRFGIRPRKANLRKDEASSTIPIVGEVAFMHESFSHLMMLAAGWMHPRMSSDYGIFLKIFPKRR
jgi:hypothetical protein